MLPRLAMLVLCQIAAVATTAGSQPALPAPGGAVNDFANVLSESEERQLTARVEDVKQATTAEIAVVTVPSLDGRTVEDYATALFASWGIGRAGADNGVLILVAPSDRVMRIEVGYGLEDVLPDGLAGQIIRETFLPAFGEGRFGPGIIAGTDRVASIVRRNQPLNAAEQQALLAPSSGSSNDALLPYVLVPFLGLFVAAGFGLLGAGLGARTVGEVVFGVIFGGGPWLISTLVGIPAAPWILGLVAAAALAIGYALGRSGATAAAVRGSSSRDSRRWTWGSGGGGSGSSGAGSSGSSSSAGFGGGRSGGGGASGRW